MQSNQLKTVLVTGATGALGPAVIRTFQSHGWEVRTMSRRSPLSGTVAATVRHFAGDIRDEAALADALQSVDVVVHMAALLHIVNPASHLRHEYDAINVGGTSSLMRAAAESGVQRVVFISSIAVYGPTNGVADESTAPRPETPYAESKLAAEEEVLRYRRADGEPLGVVLRFAAVYGPTIKGNYERLVRALARRRFVPIGSGTNHRTLIYEDDAAEAVRLAASHPSAAGRRFNVTDTRIHTVNEIVAAICEALGRKPPRFSIPIIVAQNAARIGDSILRTFGRKASLTNAIGKYVEETAVSGDMFRRDLGFVPRWDLAAGWRRAVAEMKDTGRL